MKLVCISFAFWLPILYSSVIVFTGQSFLPDQMQRVKWSDSLQLPQTGGIFPFPVILFSQTSSRFYSEIFRKLSQSQNLHSVRIELWITEISRGIIFLSLWTVFSAISCVRSLNEEILACSSNQKVFYSSINIVLAKSIQRWVKDVGLSIRGSDTVHRMFKIKIK